MYVRMFKALSALFVLLLVVLSFTSCAPGAVNDRTVYDDASLISDDDEARINEAGRSAKNARFIVATHNYNKTRTKLYGTDVLRNMGLSQNENIVIFVITLKDSTYYCDMYTYGTADRRIDDYEVEDILLENDKVIRAVKSGRLGDAMVSCIGSSNSAMEIPFLIIAIISVVVGIIGGGIAVGIVVGKYKMRMQPTNYPLNKYAQMELTHSRDDFINSRVIVKVIPRSSSGGGRSGGGGGRMGGGGGHRGGI